ncbi:nematode fatty acid retinoid binding protein [Teladorsagia circumcincta]|uniref:Fatty-acid and retinol-binding protein 1 n=1 Tax=Teladorsagia circumcincta TaxID=45464 RepID=A0A2G9U8C7_TELCI|nr:nematode fatty acid retinoid binding protein [Teladorsagia circumcincta]
MIRQVVLAAALLCLCSCDHAYTLDDIPAQYKELMPKEAKNFLTSLSKADKAAIMEIAKNAAQYNTEEEALEALKVKAPELGARVEKIYDTMKKRIEALGPEAKHYVKEIMAVARKIHDSIAEGKKLIAADLKEAAHKEIERPENAENVEELREKPLDRVVAGKVVIISSL